MLYGLTLNIIYLYSILINLKSLIIIRIYNLDITKLVTLLFASQFHLESDDKNLYIKKL